MSDIRTTPFGVASYPHLSHQDPKYGGYDVKMLFNPEDIEGLLADLEEMREEKFKETIAYLKKKKQAAKAAQLARFDITKDVYDSEGELTGQMEIRFTSQFKPRIEDTQRNAITDPNFVLYGGSIIRVAFEPRAYYNPSQGTVGVKLYLKAVQIKDLVNSPTASKSFFDKEDGFVYESTEDTETTSDFSEDDVDIDF